LSLLTFGFPEARNAVIKFRSVIEKYFG
jgi:hypothetical protein